MGKGRKRRKKAQRIKRKWYGKEKKRELGRKRERITERLMNRKS